MTIFTVDFSFRAAGHDYSALWRALEAADAHHLLDTSWLIDVNQDLKEVTQALLALCAPGDGLFVTELAPETRWTGTGMGEETKAWIAQRKVKHLSSPTPTPPGKLN